MVRAANFSPAPPGEGSSPARDPRRELDSFQKRLLTHKRRYGRASYGVGVKKITGLVPQRYLRVQDPSRERVLPPPFSGVPSPTKISLWQGL
jgi:hypothetical protein